MPQQSKESAFKPTAAQVRAMKMLGGRNLHTLLYGGARSGKTFVILYKIASRAIREPGSRHCCLRKHFIDIRKSLINDTFPTMMSMCFPQMPYRINSVLFFTRFANGSEIWFGGMDNGDRILGNEYSTIFFNECSELTYSQVELAYSRNAQKCQNIRNRFFYDENPVGKNHWSYRLFIEGVKPSDGTPLVKPQNYAQMRMNPVDNLENLSATYMDSLNEMGARHRARFRDGEWQDDSENALWHRDTMIDPFRITQDKLPILERLVIGVDPAVTSGTGSDMTGIVAAGKAKNPVTGEYEYYVLDDRSLRATPNEWAKEVIELYVDYDADRVVAEVNQGGDLVESLLRRIEPSVAYTAVHATRGKILRAEPIAALYERGMVHHVGLFQELEDEMCSYTGGEQEESPDHMDALVWALTELSNGHITVSGGDADGLL